MAASLFWYPCCSARSHGCLGFPIFAWPIPESVGRLYWMFWSVVLTPRHFPYVCTFLSAHQCVALTHMDVCILASSYRTGMDLATLAVSLAFWSEECKSFQFPSAAVSVVVRGGCSIPATVGATLLSSYDTLPAAAAGSKHNGGNCRICFLSSKYRLIVSLCPLSALAVAAVAPSGITLLRRNALGLAFLCGPSAAF